MRDLDGLLIAPRFTPLRRRLEFVAAIAF